MASLERRPTSKIYHIIFRFNAHRYKRSLATTTFKKALSCKARLEDTIELVRNGHLHIPNDADVPTFLLSEGKRTNPKIASKANGKEKPPLLLTLENVFKLFFDSIPDENVEQSTIDCLHIHERHLIRILKHRFELQTLSLRHLQAYVKRRAGETSQYGTKITGTTINKELATLGTVWRWAVNSNLITGTFPRNGLRLPKTKEAPPFQTWEEIERQIEFGSLSKEQEDRLWKSLYLCRNEIDDLLSCVSDRASYGFIYPMFVLAAHTGARRSELLRSETSDFDFQNSIVTIRERKRVRHKQTTRRVPLSPTVQAVVQYWLEHDHPGGPFTFCHTASPTRSRSRPTAGMPITKDQAHSHFRATLKGTRWSKVRGWHCLRHSFISNLASRGVDQRLIDEFVGHTTEEMRRRYRHLFPDVKHKAICSVFG